MRAYEIYESGTTHMSSLDMARHVLVPEFGFKEYTPDRMFVKYISDLYYITAQCYSGSIVLALFNRKTMKTDDKFEIDGGNKDGDFISFREKHKLLNKLTEWTRKFSDNDPQVEMTEAPVTYQKGDPVTYDLHPNKRNSPRGNAVFKMMSSKKNHAYIETETEGTIMVPIAELAPGNTK